MGDSGTGGGERFCGAVKERFDETYNNPVALAIVGTVSTITITMVLVSIDPDKSFEEVLGTNKGGKSCKVGVLTGVVQPDILIVLTAVIFVCEIILLCSAIVLYRRSENGNGGQGNGAQQQDDQDQPECCSCSWLRSKCQELCYGTIHKKENPRILCRWTIHLLSVFPVFLLGKPGVGAFIISVAIEVLLFEPAEDSSAFYQLEDTGALGHLIMYFSFVENFDNGRKVLLRVFIGMTLVWLLIKRCLRGEKWTRECYQGVDRILLVLGAIFLVESDCPANSALYALILTLSPAQLMSVVHALVAGAWALLLAPLCQGLCECRGLCECWTFLRPWLDKCWTFLGKRLTRSDPNNQPRLAKVAQSPTPEILEGVEEGPQQNRVDSKPAGKYNSSRTGKYASPKHVHMSTSGRFFLLISS